ncbi:unnamed protein product [Cyclocybe aegerita]|uniref:F-box domain-containing protein n=1 Tax=Cyclocybe aegerita TaxID=1973307 RepID=A0A8S0WMX0_CYCAE|nr:unnamed protein product [Cyclocybe aegerita]
MAYSSRYFVPTELDDIPPTHNRRRYDKIKADKMLPHTSSPCKTFISLWKLCGFKYMRPNLPTIPSQIIMTKGFDSEQTYMTSPEAKRLVPLSHEVSTYIQGFGVIPNQEEAAILENLRTTRQGEEKLKELAVVSSILAPIRRLPPELLTKIFRLTTAEPQPPAHPEDRSPMVLCSVSTLWRNIAIKDPFLWTQIRFDYPVYSEYIQSEEYCNSDEEELTPSRDESHVVEEYRRMLRRVQVFVQRAGSAPLLLSVGDCRTDTIRIVAPSPTLQAYRQNAFNTLVSLFPRCWSLQFYVDHAWRTSFFTKLPPGILSKLENLQISFHQETTASSPIETQLFKLSPLRHYHLFSEFPRDLAHISVPHLSLETLTILLSDRAYMNTNLPCTDAVEMWRTFLLKCTNLRVAYVSYLLSNFLLVLHSPTLSHGLLHLQYRVPRWHTFPDFTYAPIFMQVHV